MDADRFDRGWRAGAPPRERSRARRPPRRRTTGQRRTAAGEPPPRGLKERPAGAGLAGVARSKIRALYDQALRPTRRAGGRSEDTQVGRGVAHTLAAVHLSVWARRRDARAEARRAALRTGAPPRAAPVRCALPAGEVRRRRADPEDRPKPPRAGDARRPPSCARASRCGATRSRRAAGSAPSPTSRRRSPSCPTSRPPTRCARRC
jgi:hypothetical protein